MKNYWTCSKFADWLRGTTKPKVGTAEQWDNWERRAKAQYPIRWWLAEEGLDYIQNFITYIPDKLYSIKYYINNRWVTRTHSLTAHPRDIKPGQWQDVGNRFLPCLFNELQDFVEVELAWWHIVWEGKETHEKYNAPFWASGWFRWRTWRCPQAGLDNLEWQKNLVADESWGLNPGDKGYGAATAQAKNAQEILALYKWWTEVYQQRPDPHDASGWTEYCALKREEYKDSGLGFMSESKNPKVRAAGKLALKKCREIENAYEREDEKMLIRLIKIRNSLWT
jgi:hypothetical protein